MFIQIEGFRGNREVNELWLSSKREKHGPGFPPPLFLKVTLQPLLSVC